MKQKKISPRVRSGRGAHPQSRRERHPLRSPSASLDPHFEYYQLIVDHLHEGVVVQTPEGVVIASNPSAQRILRESQSLVGRNVYSVMVPYYRDDGTVMAEHERPINRVLASGVEALNERVGLKLVTGDVVWINENIVPVMAQGDTTPSKVVVSFTDIGPEREAQRRLQHLATRDSLTGLYNRAYLIERMRDLFPAMSDSATQGPSTALLFIDLDGFKQVNDSAGHETGDDVLCEVAARLLGSTREHDVVARVGGDEFVLVLRRFPGTAQIEAICRRIIRVLSQPFETDSGPVQIGASIGICLYPRDGRDGLTLMRNADAAMFSAKIEGRNTFRFFVPELSEQVE